MISLTDIEAWREDEIQTEFLNRQRRRADNHVGWGIQSFSTKEWKKVSIVFKNKEACTHCLRIYKEVYPLEEFRVYELVREKL